MKLFARVELLPSPFEGRFIIRATRRRIEHLLVVSGPSAVGKSTFISWLQAGMPEGLRLKCPEGAGEWPQVSANDLFKTDDRPAQLDEPELPGMVLHYDFLRPYHTRSHIYERDQALELLSCAENLTVIVLNVGQERLIRQFKEAKLCRESSISQGQASVVQGNRGRSRIPNAVRRVLRRLRKGKPRNATPKKDKLREYREGMLSKYETPGWVEEWYEAWRRYVAESHPTAEVIEMTVPESAK